MADAVAVILAAAVGALSGIVTTAWKTRKDLESQYDIDLRKHRIDVYKKLWKELQPLAYHSPQAPLTYGAVQELSERLRSWYYDEGGLFLSEKTRAPYLHLQEALTKLATPPPKREQRDALDDETTEIVKALGSRLRTSSTRDVSTRVGPRLGPSLASAVARRWRWWAPLRMSVDRRWSWDAKGAHTCFFVLLENRTDRVVEISKLSLDGVDAASMDPGLPLLVQAGEPLEVAVVPRAKGQPGQTPTIQVRLTSGWQPSVKVPPDIPIPARVLKLPTE